MNIDLQGRTALITGASKGLGLATALRLAESGAQVAIVARGRDALDEAYEAIKERAGSRRVAAHVCDVTQPAQIDAAFSAARAQLGPFDILINNAGGHALGRFQDITDEMWSHDIDVKLMATVRMTRLAWPEMIERRWGRIINVLNTFAKAPAAGTAPTAVTRAAQLALTKVLSKEGAPHNVLANALLVGLIQSDQIRRLIGEDVPRDEGHFAQQQIGNRQIPLGRIGEPQEFADIACFLASENASYITGTAINVDGGMSAVI